MSFYPSSPSCLPLSMASPSTPFDLESSLSDVAAFSNMEPYLTQQQHHMQTNTHAPSNTDTMHSSSHHIRHAMPPYHSPPYPPPHPHPSYSPYVHAADFNSSMLPPPNEAAPHELYPSANKQTVNILTPTQQMALYEEFLKGTNLHQLQQQFDPIQKRDARDREMQRHRGLHPAPTQMSSPPQHTQSPPLQAHARISYPPSSSGTSSGASSRGTSDDGMDSENSDNEGVSAIPSFANMDLHGKRARTGEFHVDAMTGPTEADDERLSKRLARKAELARASRRRKKMYIHDLEAKVKKLTRRVEELEQQNMTLRRSQGIPYSNEEKSRADAQASIRVDLSQLLSQPELDVNALKKIAELVNQFVTNSRNRQMTVQMYLDRVEQCLCPGLQVKFAMWGLSQGDHFFFKPGLWQSLMQQHIGLSSQQEAALLAKREHVTQVNRRLAECEAMLNETRSSILTQLQAVHAVGDEIMSILNPRQLAKYFLWIENNEWAMAMLKSMMVHQAGPSPPIIIKHDAPVPPATDSATTTAAASSNNNNNSSSSSSSSSATVQDSSNNTTNSTTNAAKA